MHATVKPEQIPARAQGIGIGGAFSLLMLVFGTLFLIGLGLLAVDQQRVVDTASEMQNETMPKMIRYQRLARNIEQIRQEGERVIAAESPQVRAQSLSLFNLIVSHPSVREHKQAAELSDRCQSFLIDVVKRAEGRSAVGPADKEAWRALSNRLGFLVDDIFIESANFVGEEVSVVSQSMHQARAKLIMVLSVVAMALVLLSWLLGRLLIRPLRQLGRELAALNNERRAPQFKPSPLGEIGALQSAVGELHRLLQQKEEERIASEKLALETADAAKRVQRIFLDNISHELRTPMNGIMGMTHLALRRVSDPKAQEQLTTAMGSAKQLLRLIEDLIDMSQLEAKRLDLRVSRFSVDKLLTGVALYLEPLATKKGLQLQTVVAPELRGLELKGDSGRLEQILKHLGTNALKFTESGGATLMAEVQGESEAGLQLRFAVSDTGCGIAESLRSRLFTLFEQGDGSPTRKHGGTGLGLALCKQLVETMAGEIGVDSNEGGGSTFWFKVRVARSAGLESAAREGAEQKAAL